MNSLFSLNRGKIISRATLKYISLQHILVALNEDEESPEDACKRRTDSSSSSRLTVMRNRVSLIAQFADDRRLYFSWEKKRKEKKHVKRP